MDVVDRTITLLEHLSQHPEGVGVVRLADALGLAPSTAHRYLATLQARHLVEQTDRKHYRLTSRLYLLGLAVRGQSGLERQLETTLHALADASNETVCLMVRDDYHAVCVAQVDSKHPLKIAAQVGSRQDLRLGATARVLLAHAPPEIQEYVLGLPPLELRTSDTVTDPEQIRTILRRIRSEGYYLSRGEVDDGVLAVAAPVRNHRGEVIASLVVAAPQARVSSSYLRSLIDMVVRNAEDASKKLGHNCSVAV